MDFKLWVESVENDAKAAILNVVSGSSGDLSDQEEEHFLQRRTTEFSGDIIKKIKNLGIISSISHDDFQKFNDINNSISKGITIGDLIDKIQNLDPGLSNQSGAGQMLSDPKLYPQQAQPF